MFATGPRTSAGIDILRSNADEFSDAMCKTQVTSTFAGSVNSAERFYQASAGGDFVIKGTPEPEKRLRGTARLPSRPVPSSANTRWPSTSRSPSPTPTSRSLACDRRRGSPRPIFHCTPPRVRSRLSVQARLSRRAASAPTTGRPPKPCESPSSPHWHCASMMGAPVQTDITEVVPAHPPQAYSHAPADLL